MVADREPISAGSIEAEFDRMFSSKLNTVTIETIFYPRENTVALDFKYEFVRYRQFWSEEGRRQFTEAFGRYREDYAARRLLTRYSKSRAVYGKVKSAVEWETFKFTTSHRAAPLIELGYRFRGEPEAPFFAVLQRSAKEEGVSGDGANLESLQITMYFTRAQAEELVKIFEQSYLLGLLGADETPNPAAPVIEDEYREYSGPASGGN
jgi:hypothetical protein